MALVYNTGVKVHRIGDKLYLEYASGVVERVAQATDDETHQLFERIITQEPKTKPPQKIIERLVCMRSMSLCPKREEFPDERVYLGGDPCFSCKHLMWQGRGDHIRLEKQGPGSNLKVGTD